MTLILIERRPDELQIDRSDATIKSHGLDFNGWLDVVCKRHSQHLLHKSAVCIVSIIHCAPTQTSDLQTSAETMQKSALYNVLQSIASLMDLREVIYVGLVPLICVLACVYGRVFGHLKAIFRTAAESHNECAAMHYRCQHIWC